MSGLPYGFEDYIDPNSELDDDGDIKPCSKRTLIKDAPQSAIDAFERFKKRAEQDEKDGIL